MINASKIKILLQSILGQIAPLGSGFTTINEAYLCLGYNVTINTSGDISSFEEPEAEKGYKRYLIGSSTNDIHPEVLVDKCVINKNQAYNIDTIYFDTALADWTTESKTIKYFGIANSINGLPVAYGYLVNGNDQPIELQIKKDQTAIIRPEQLKLAIDDLNPLPTKTYYMDIKSNDDTEIYSGIIKSTTIANMVDNINYSQVIILDLFERDPEAKSYININSGDILFIPSLNIIVDTDVWVNFYTNTMVKLDGKITIRSAE